LLRELLLVFKHEFPHNLLALREAVEAKDENRVATAAHTSKGMLLNLAANRAAATVAQLEQLGRQGEVAGFAALFATFENETGKLLPQLDACMQEACK
jgi:HPt (histidine-containing phosphotransfer) domain-containing protein